MEWVNLNERMTIGKSYSRFTFAKILRARSLNADTKRKRLRGCGGGDGGGVWGERVVVGQDGEDASARGTKKCNASEDAESWGGGGAGGDAGRDSGEGGYHGGSGGGQAVSAED